jgi:hypothetical protein
MTRDDIVVVIMVVMLTVGLLVFAIHDGHRHYVPQTYEDQGGSPT